jgi:ribosomal protein S18 acetylase RimI-like enzyme
MQTYSRPYHHDTDFWRIRDLLIATYPRNQNRHNWEIRRWEGWCSHRGEDDALIGDRPWQATVRVWETAAGDLVGAVHPEGPGWIFLEIHPDFRHLEDEMIAWGEEHLAVPGPDGGQQAYLDVYEYDTLRQSLLVRRGYEQLPGFGAYRRRWMDQPIPAIAIPDGYTVRTLRDDDADCQRFADLLNAAFGRTFHTAEELRRFHQSPSYRSDLDIVIEAPDGTLAATAGVTYDAANRVGTFEPVCTHPDHLRRKLAQAAMVEGLRRLAALGAAMAEVGTGDMVAANRLYESLDFTDVDIDHAWRKVW